MCSNRIPNFESRLLEFYEQEMKACLRLAQNPGWKAYIWHKVQELDKDELFTGFKADFLRRLSEEKDQWSARQVQTNWRNQMETSSHRIWTHLEICQKAWHIRFWTWSKQVYKSNPKSLIKPSSQQETYDFHAELHNRLHSCWQRQTQIRQNGQLG